MGRAALASVLLAACSRSPAPPGAVDPNHRLDVVSKEVSLRVDARAFGGTISRPARGRWPAVLFMAGGGPSDRDWTTPVLGSNGSGRLLGDALSSRGAIVLRFDKAFTRGNRGPSRQEGLSMATYLEEARAALAFLRAQPGVRTDRVFVAGHSEGAIHAIRLAADQPSALAGVILLAPPGRRMADVMAEQVQNTLRLNELPDRVVEAQMLKLRNAFEDFISGKPITADDLSDFEEIQGQFAFAVGRHSDFYRELWRIDLRVEALRVEVPLLIATGGKDVQVSQERDGKALVAALRSAGRDVTLVVAPDADHVLKHEPKTMAELMTTLHEVAPRYNMDGRALDDAILAGLVAWLAERTRT